MQVFIFFLIKIVMMDIIIKILDIQQQQLVVIVAVVLALTHGLF